MNLTANRKDRGRERMYKEMKTECMEDEFRLINNQIWKNKATVTIFVIQTTTKKL